MPLPLLLGFALTALGGAVSAWYVSLSPSDKRKVDKFCWDWAKNTFGVDSPGKLTKSQARSAAEHAKGVWAQSKPTGAVTDILQGEILPPARTRRKSRSRS